MRATAIGWLALLCSGCPQQPGGDGGGDPADKTLTMVVQKDGDGLGSVLSDPEGIDCGTDCETQEREFVIGGNVVLTAEPARNALFAGWACTLPEGEARGGLEDAVVAGLPDDAEGTRITCTATFRQLYTLLVFSVGDGSGRVTGTLLRGDGVTPRIDCASDGTGDCSAGYFADEVDTLTATPDPGSVFDGWQIDCGTGTAPATVTLDEDKNCEASFSPQ